MKESRESLLAQYGLSGLPPSEALLLRYGAGSFLSQAEYPLPYLLLLLDGRAKVTYSTESGRTLLFRFMEAGELIGDMELFNGEHCAASTVQAITHTECLGVSLAVARRELASNIVFCNRVGAVLANKMSRSIKNNVANVLQPLDVRLMRYITCSARDGYFEENRTELADLLGTSYRHLLRTLDALCARGVLERRGNGFLLHDPCTDEQFYP